MVRRGGRLRRRLAGQAAGAAIGLVVDRWVGDPSDRWHPVAWFGRAMARRERRQWLDDRAAGARHAAVGGGAGALAGGALAAFLPGPLAVAAATTVAGGGRSLSTAGARIGGLLGAGDLEGARRALPVLVGRDAAGLGEKEIARAVVESLAENTVDAVVATALWGALGGAPGALAHRALNTLDAMVGYRTPRHERFGWASARADDLAAWPAARMTAALVAAVRPARAAAIWRAVHTDARAHPSPNAGVAEAAFAAALGLRLGGPTSYHGHVEVRPDLGGGRPAEVADIDRALHLVRDVSAALVTLLLLPGAVLVLGGLRRRRRGPGSPGREGAS